MKLLHIKWAHPCNVAFIVRACKLFQIEYHYTNDTSPPDQQYDIIWAPCSWIDPDQYPHSKIIFGPHFWVFPDPNDPIFTHLRPEHASRCIYLTLSDWNKTIFNEFIPKSKQMIPFVSIPFGLVQDIPYKKEEIEWDCILYYKNRHPSLYSFCEEFVKLRGLRYKIIQYGSYNKQDYLSSLQKTKCVIWVGEHESQGFGLEECLATNTPIFLYDVLSMKDEYVNGTFTYQHYPQSLLATTAPYWNEKCGMKVYSNEEFITRFSEFMDALSGYQPAVYFESTLTDRVCFERFLNALNLNISI